MRKFFATIIASLLIGSATAFALDASLSRATSSAIELENALGRTITVPAVFINSDSSVLTNAVTLTVTASVQNLGTNTFSDRVIRTETLSFVGFTNYAPTVPFTLENGWTLTYTNSQAGATNTVVFMREDA